MTIGCFVFFFCGFLCFFLVFVGFFVLFVGFCVFFFFCIFCFCGFEPNSYRFGNKNVEPLRGDKSITKNQGAHCELPKIGYLQIHG